MVFNFKKLEKNAHGGVVNNPGYLNITKKTVTIYKSPSKNWLPYANSTDTGGLAVPMAIYHDETHNAIQLVPAVDGFRFRLLDGNLNIGKPSALANATLGLYKPVQGMDNVWVLAN